MQLVEAGKVRLDEPAATYLPELSKLQVLDGGTLRAPKSAVTVRQLLPVVYQNYFRPELEAFQPRTLWILSNAFTSALKDLKPMRQFQATAKVGAFLAGFDGG